MRCATIRAASIWFSLSFEFPFNLDWLDFEMEPDEGEHQALQILQENYVENRNQ